MKTKVYKDSLERPSEILKNGGLVAVPTETVYGLAGNGLDENAVRNIYEVKGRPAVKPLSLMVHDSTQMEKYCEDVPPQAYALAKKFWPGPLTIVMKAKSFIPSIVLAGGTTVGLRCPDHPMTLKALELSGVPFAAPSANPSGEPSPKNAETVLRYFDGRIDAVIDGGECGIGTESTLIGMAETPYKIFRLGALSREEIADALVENMCVLGITGPTGCGKTTALDVLASMGVLVIDCDKVYHTLLNDNSEMKAALRTRFPAAFDGEELDRKALAAAVFSDEAALSDLNAVTHPFVAAAVREKLREHAMNGSTLAAIDAAELISSGLGALCTATFGVLAPKEKRVERIMARDGIDRGAALMRVQAQKSDDYFRQNCGIIIENNGEFFEFQEKCKKIFTEVINNG